MNAAVTPPRAPAPTTAILSLFAIMVYAFFLFRLPDETGRQGIGKVRLMACQFRAER
jgi:hypothetical protein